jgi:isoleucyl-tRNA synthetase
MSKSLGNTTAPQDVIRQYGADILRLWVMNTDITEDQRLGPEILKQQAELYRRLRNTLRWLLGGLEGFEAAERVPYAELPELERWVLHRLAGLDDRVREAVRTHAWTGVYPEIHAFCASDLSAFYFDIRKDALYCDAAGSLKRRAVRTVLDLLHRQLCAWLAPALVFTAEEAWLARFGGEEESIHLHDFPAVPPEWRDEALAAKWVRVRALRRTVTASLEDMRRLNEIGSSLQAEVTLFVEPDELGLLSEAEWAEVCIVSSMKVRSLDLAEGRRAPTLLRGIAPGAKCARCWRVLPEVGRSAVHPALCRRCEAVVEAQERTPAAAA